jgi:quinol monooxygenase YgiN
VSAIAEMPEPIIYIDRSEVRPGKLDELRRALDELVELVEANEPQLGGYRVYFTEDGAQMTVIHEHADSASLELHMKIAGPAFLRFVELVRLLTIDVYGRPSEALLTQIHHKATLLGSATVTVHDLHAGFTRPGTG